MLRKMRKQFQLLPNKFITKDDTLFLKGYAILIMVFLHVFGGRALGLVSYNELVDIQISGKNLTYILSHFCSICVHLYIFLSGYGYYICYLQRKEIKVKKKCFQLCSKIIFIAICIYPFSFFSPELKWEITISSFWEYCLGYKGNYEWWFLRPYVVILIISIFILKSMQKNRSRVIGLVILNYFFIKGLIILDKAFWMPLIIQQVGILLLPFVLGIICAQEGILYKAKMLSINKKYRYGGAILLFLLIIQKSIFPQGILDPFIAVIFSFCILVIFPRHQKIFLYLGKKATVMWLVHTFTPVRDNAASQKVAITISNKVTDT